MSGKTCFRMKPWPICPGSLSYNEILTKNNHKIQCKSLPLLLLLLFMMMTTSNHPIWTSPFFIENVFLSFLFSKHTLKTGLWWKNK